MASIQFWGLGSGLNTSEMMEAILTAEKFKITGYQNKQKIAQNKKTAWGNISTSFQNVSTNLKQINSVIKKTIEMDTDKFIAVSSYKNAVDGDYNVKVINKTQVIDNVYATNQVDDIHAALGIEATIYAEGKDYAISINKDDSLYTIAQKLNTKVPSDIADMDESYKNVDPFSTEAVYIQDNRLVVNREHEDNYWNTTKLNSILRKAGISGRHDSITKEATVVVNGKTYSSETGQFKIDGLEFKVLDDMVGNETNIKIDTTMPKDEIYDTVRSVIDSLNETLRTIKNSSSYNSTTKKSGVLNGDASLWTVRRLMTNTLENNVTTSEFNYLFELGISIDREGFFTLDEQKFKDAIEYNTEDTINMLTAGLNTNGTVNANANEKGFFARIQTVVDVVATNKDSIINLKMKGLDSQVEKYDKLIEKQEAYIEKRRLILERQFRAMEQIMSSMNAQTSYFDSLNKNNKN